MTRVPTVLVTGASGLVGSEAVARILEEGYSVIALTHRVPRVIRNSGRPLRTIRWDGRPMPGTMATVQGDITSPGLGLDAAARAALASHIDIVLHSAAITDFGRSASVYEAVNVTGTRHLLDLVTEWNTPLVYVSTAYVSGERSGLVLESELDEGQRFGTLYEESKFRAESMVREASAAGLPTAVVRPSIVVGHDRSGAIRDFKNIYVLLKLFSEGRVRSIPGHYDAYLDLVPVNHGAEIIGQAVIRFPDAAGRTFHAVNSRPHTLRDFSDVMAEYPAFHVPRYLPPSAFSVERMPIGEQMYYRRVVEHYESFFRRRAAFADTVTPTLVSRKPATYGQTQLRRLIDYCLKVGYLGAPLPGISDVLASLQRT